MITVKNWRKEAKAKNTKIRMVFIHKGQIAAKKIIDLENKTIKEIITENNAVISYNFEGIVKDFGTIEKYIDYNMRVWNFSLLDSMN